MMTQLCIKENGLMVFSVAYEVKKCHFHQSLQKYNQQLVGVCKRVFQTMKSIFSIVNSVVVKKWLVCSLKSPFHIWTLAYVRACAGCSLRLLKTTKEARCNEVVFVLVVTQIGVVRQIAVRLLIDQIPLGRTSTKNQKKCILLKVYSSTTAYESLTVVE